MKYSPEEVIQYVLEEDVKFIRLAFCDVFGKQKNVSIMPSELSRVFKYGAAIDASAIAGFGDVVHSDLFLHPNTDTLTVLPWRPEHGRVVRMFCDITYPDGTPFTCDPRRILKEAIAAAKAAGYTFSFGTEMEFYLFKLDENGEPTRIPYDNAGYMDLAPEDRCENIRREICLTLEQMGIQPESSHHEDGPGQNEIDFHFSEDALEAADNAVNFISVAKAIASGNGLWAEFSPKPLENAPGNGLHVNISASAVDGSADEELLPYLSAGILNRISEITAFLNPSKESYERFGLCKAPKYISWSKENRSQLIRVPAAEDIYKRVELRSPDATMNFHIAFALLIYAGLEGITGKMELPSSADLNLFTTDQETLSAFRRLPVSLDEAIAAAKSSTFIKEHLPQSIIDEYCCKKTLS